jgi:hypothetical protein
MSRAYTADCRYYSLRILVPSFFVDDELTPNEQFFQQSHGENKLHFDEMMMMSALN